MKRPSLDDIQEILYDNLWLKVMCALLIPILAAKIGGMLWLLGSFVILFVGAVWLEQPSKRRQAALLDEHINNATRPNNTNTFSSSKTTLRAEKANNNAGSSSDDTKRKRAAKEPNEVTIGMVDVKPSALIVRDSKGNFLDQLSSGVPMSLVGYTQNTVTVQRGGFNRMYRLKSNGKLEFVREFR